MAVSQQTNLRTEDPSGGQFAPRSGSVRFLELRAECDELRRKGYEVLPLPLGANGIRYWRVVPPNGDIYTQRDHFDAAEMRQLHALVTGAIQKKGDNFIMANKPAGTPLPKPSEKSGGKGKKRGSGKKQTATEVIEEMATVGGATGGSEQPTTEEPVEVPGKVVKMADHTTKNGGRKSGSGAAKTPKEKKDAEPQQTKSNPLRDSILAQIKDATLEKPFPRAKLSTLQEQMYSQEMAKRGEIGRVQMEGRRTGFYPLADEKAQPTDAAGAAAQQGADAGVEDKKAA